MMSVSFVIWMHGTGESQLSNVCDTVLVWWCQVSLVRVVLEMICFFTEIWILSKYSEDISARARRINTSQLQCKNCVCFLFFLFFILNLFLCDHGGRSVSALYFLIMTAYSPLTPCTDVFSLCPCLSFPSHCLSVICLFPMPRSLHTHAFALVDNLFRQKLSEAEVYINLVER